MFNVPTEGDAHEDNEELEHGVLKVGDKPRAVPEYLMNSNKYDGIKV